MTQNRRSNGTKPNQPPNRGANACTARSIGAWVQGPNGQIRAILTARRLGWRANRFQTAPFLAYPLAQNAPMAHQQMMRRHSKPIALRSGAAA